MGYILKENKSIGEKYYFQKHKSGLDVYVFPKKLGTAYAAFATKFGSVDNHFTCDGKEIGRCDIVAEDNVDKISVFSLFGKMVKYFFNGLC